MYLTVGLMSHTDPNVIMMLLQNHVLGLQVKHKDKWVDVKPMHDGLIVNVNNFLQVIYSQKFP